MSKDSSSNKKGFDYVKKDLGKQQLELSVNVDKDRFQSEKAKIFKVLSKDIEISGFRKGNAPKNLLEAKLGPSLFEETVNHLLPEITVEIIQDEKLIPISRVEYKVSKVSDDGVEFTATFSLYPEIKLGNFKKIKIKEESSEVSDKEVDDVIEKMFEDYKKRLEVSEEKSTNGDTRAVTSESTDTKEKDSKTSALNEIKMDDEWAKKAGQGADTMIELKEKTKEQLRAYKKGMVRDKYVNDVVMEAVRLSKFEIPEALVDQELDRKEADYKNRIESLGLKVDEYLKTQNTTLEDLKKQWKEDAERKVQVELVLIEIAKENELNIGEEDVEKELESIQDEKLRDSYKNSQGRTYIRGVMTQQKAIKHLLSITGGDKNFDNKG